MAILDDIKVFLPNKDTLRRIALHATIVIVFLSPVWILAATLENGAQKFTDTWRRDLLPLTCSGDGKTEFVIHTDAIIANHG
jgi:hypothetical protein